MLVELRLAEQRLKAVLEVLDGANVTDVTRHYRVVRETVQDCLQRYGNQCLAGLADRSSRPRAVRTRWPLESRPGWSSCVWPIGAGVRPPSSTYRNLTVVRVAGLDRHYRRGEWLVGHGHLVFTNRVTLELSVSLPASGRVPTCD